MMPKKKLLSFDCKKLQFENSCLSILQPDNCVLLMSRKVCIIKSIRYIEKTYIFQGLLYSYHNDLYTSPIKSSELHIFFVEKLVENKSVKFNLNNILCKCMIVPHKNGFAVFPLFNFKF